MVLVASLGGWIAALVVGVILIIVARSFEIEPIVNKILYIIGAILVIVGLILFVLWLIGFVV